MRTTIVRKMIWFAVIAAVVAAIAGAAWYNASCDERAAREAAAAGAICEGGAFSECVFLRFSAEGYVFAATIRGIDGTTRGEVVVRNGAARDYLARDWR